jgi:hypothetical protein
MFPWYFDTALVMLVVSAFAAIWSFGDGAKGVKVTSWEGDRR